MAETAKTGLLDLERELTCSVSLERFHNKVYQFQYALYSLYGLTISSSKICTEVLYQPLTLLDCLHTFCGSCLKEWFSWQASQATPSKPSPFTCPSCRASVRETRPNATVTTLLDMYLQANPGRARSEQEKEEIKKRYTTGENVLPKIRWKQETDDEEEDRRMVEEVREMSLREVGIRSSDSYERGTRHRPRETAMDARIEHARQRRRYERNHSTGAEVAGPSTSTDPAVQARQIEHQSSLRSLLSASDVNSSEMEEEILRQIIDEGILDGIDLNNIDVSQEDELSEKIAEAYRRRHRQRAGPQGVRSERPQASNARERRSDAQEQRQQRRTGRSPMPTDRGTHSSHPPVSRPHLLEAYPTGPSYGRRTASETRRQTSPNPASSTSRASSETQRQAARSATDLTNRPQSSSGQQSRPTDFSGRGRRTTDPERLRPPGQHRTPTSQTPQASRSPRTRSREISSSLANAATVSPPQSSPNAASRSGPTMTQEIPRLDDSPRTSSRALSQPSVPAATQPPSYPEPSISCDGCGRPNLEYELHQNCSRCNKGKYNICLRCYRSGRGCLHWFGFGWAAMQRYRRQESTTGYPPNYPLPHRFIGHRYKPPPPETLYVSITGSSVSTSSDPSTRLQSGPFCSNCSNFTPDCYWKCDVCNEAEWGYCNVCVNQGKCCTHALLPATCLDPTHSSTSSLSTQNQHSSITLLTQSPKSTAEGYPIDPLSGERYTPLTFSTKCDICTYPIPPSNTRFHCPQCNIGDYDICTPCYHKLVNAGKISTENGHRGWRRCPNGHRMIIVGFQDSNIGQRRIVVEDLVGGHALKDEPTGDDSLEWSWRDEGQRQAITVSKASKAVTGRAKDVTDSPLANGGAAPPLLKTYPPNGGVGMHVQALWSWWPDEEAKDELAFPKGAEIRECEDINGDWFWGIYCAKKGLFPSNYGRILEVVRM